MNRRSFLSALLAIPVVGPVVKPAAEYFCSVDPAWEDSVTIVSVYQRIDGDFRYKHLHSHTFPGNVLIDNSSGETIFYFNKPDVPWILGSVGSHGK